MRHSCPRLVGGPRRCLATGLSSEKAESILKIGYTAEYHRTQVLAAQMALEQRTRLVVSITLRDLSESSLKALDEFFRQAAAQIRKSS